MDHHLSLEELHNFAMLTISQTSINVNHLKSFQAQNVMPLVLKSGQKSSESLIIMKLWKELKNLILCIYGMEEVKIYLLRKQKEQHLIV